MICSGWWSRVQSVVAGELGQQEELEAAGHIASKFRKPKGIRAHTRVLTSHSLFHRGLPRDRLAHKQQGSPHINHHNQNTPKHTCLKVILEPAKLTALIIMLLLTLDLQ